MCGHQEDSLSNIHNMSQLINLLMMQMHRNGINALQTSGDADVDVVKTAINKFLGTVEEHTFRTNHQVHLWLRKEPNGEAPSWGWKRRNDQLVPKLSELDAAPDEIVKMIFCRCTKGYDSGRKKVTTMTSILYQSLWTTSPLLTKMNKPQENNSM
ncbi:hypothetical protein JTB14_022288 [Gonioctena quinquepunctata]|nr:hypothetical protein JTB14_022288 [Gonioctena quinquepunctata]